MDCVFCEAISQGHYIYKDEISAIIVDKYPSAREHYLVIPLEHHEGYLKTPSDILRHMHEVASKHYPGYIQGYHRKLFSSIPHTHLHIIKPPWLGYFKKLKFKGFWFVSVKEVEDKIGSRL
jgi:diadenosine tetraphosphate (Ap4A) HIT family hydrolase